MRIGELAKRSGTNVETVRYYERIGLLVAPPRTGANYRSYGRGDLARLTFIRRARDLGFTLDDVRELLALSGDGSESCVAVDVIAARHREVVVAKIASLAALRDELERAIAACGRGQVADCRILEALGVPVDG